MGEIDTDAAVWRIPGPKMKGRIEHAVPLAKQSLALFEQARALTGDGRYARLKRPCQPGTLYCFHCREPRAPALGMVDFVLMRPGRGNLRALCATCETIMHRRVREGDIAKVMPNCTVQFVQGQPTLTGQAAPAPPWTNWTVTRFLFAPMQVRILPGAPLPNNRENRWRGSGQAPGGRAGEGGFRGADADFANHRVVWIDHRPV